MFIMTNKEHNQVIMTTLLIGIILMVYCDYCNLLLTGMFHEQTK